MTGVDDFAYDLEHLESVQRWHARHAEDLRSEAAISTMLGVHDLGDVDLLEVEQTIGRGPSVTWSSRHKRSRLRAPATWIAVVRARAALDRSSSRS